MKPLEHKDIYTPYVISSSYNGIQFYRLELQQPIIIAVLNTKVLISCEMCFALT